MNTRPGAVRLYAPDHPSLAVTVRARLEKRRQELIQELGEGYARDWIDYNKRAGVIEGIGFALDICGDIEQELNER